MSQPETLDMFAPLTFVLISTGKGIVLSLYNANVMINNTNKDLPCIITCFKFKFIFKNYRQILQWTLHAYSNANRGVQYNLETILRQNKSSQYTLSHYTIDRLKKRCIIITILLK